MNARKLLAPITGMVALLVMAGCGDVKSPTYIPPLEELKVCAELSDGSCPTSGSACVARTQPDPSVVPLNYSLQYCALGRYEELDESNGDVVLGDQWRDLTDEVFWSVGGTNGSAYVEITASGLATGVIQTPSAVPVTANFDGFESISYLRVTAPELEEVDINPNGDVTTLIGLETEFQCLGGYSGACSTSGSATCDISNTASFASSDEAVFEFDDALGFGTGLALSEGVTTISCSEEGLESDPDATLNVCADSAITDVQIRIPPATEEATELSLAIGGEKQLQLVATYTDCAADDGSAIEIDVTSAATWSSTAADVAAADADGLVTTGDDGGQTEITGTFRGVPSDTLAVSVAFAEIDRIEVSGPELAVAGVQTTLEYTATAFFQDTATGDEVEQRDVSADAEWTTSVADVIVFTPGNGGTAMLDAAAQEQAVTVTATYEGLQDSVDTQILTTAAVKGLSIVPDVACIGDALSLGLDGKTPIQLVALAELEYTDAGGEVQSCAVNATDNSEWSAGAADLTSGLLGNLLAPIPGLNIIGSALSDILTTVLGECEDTLPINIGSSPTDSPITVTNTAPGKGVVAPNPDAITLAGGACVYASLNAFESTASVLVATELQSVCEALLASPPPEVTGCPGEDLSGSISKKLSLPLR